MLSNSRAKNRLKWGLHTQVIDLQEDSEMSGVGPVIRHRRRKCPGASGLPTKIARGPYKSASSAETGEPKDAFPSASTRAFKTLAFQTACSRALPIPLES